MNKGAIKTLISNSSSIKPINVFSFDNRYKKSYYQKAFHAQDKMNQQQNNQTKGKKFANRDMKCVFSKLNQEMGDKGTQLQKEAKRQSDPVLFTRNVKGRNKEEFGTLNRQKYISTEPVNLLLGNIRSEERLNDKKEETMQSIDYNANTLEGKTWSNKEKQSQKKFIFDDIEHKHYTYFNSTINTNGNNNQTAPNNNLNGNVNKKIAEMTSKIFSEKEGIKCNNDFMTLNPPTLINNEFCIKQVNKIDEKKDYISVISKTQEPSSLSEPISYRNDDTNIININNIQSKSINKYTIKIKEENDIIKRGKSNGSLLVLMNDQIIQMGFENEKLKKNLKQKEYVISKLKKEISDIKNQKDKENGAYIKKIHYQDETLQKINQKKKRIDDFMKQLIMLINKETEKVAEMNGSDKEDFFKLVREYLNDIIEYCQL